MIRLLADEDLRQAIIMGFRRRRPLLEFPRAQELGLGGSSDAEVLRYAAANGYMLVSHDVNTMTDAANVRLDAGEPMPGLAVVRQGAPDGIVIEDLILVVEASHEGEWDGQFVYLPFARKS